MGSEELQSRGRAAEGAVKVGDNVFDEIPYRSQRLDQKVVIEEGLRRSRWSCPYKFSSYP